MEQKIELWYSGRRKTSLYCLVVIPGPGAKARFLPWVHYTLQSSGAWSGFVFNFRLFIPYLSGAHPARAGSSSSSRSRIWFHLRGNAHRNWVQSAPQTLRPECFSCVIAFPVPSRVTGFVLFGWKKKRRQFDIILQRVLLQKWIRGVISRRKYSIIDKVTYGNSMAQWFPEKWIRKLFSILVKFDLFEVFLRCSLPVALV